MSVHDHVERARIDPATVDARMRHLLVLPGDAGWDEARAAWNLAIDQHPAAVAWPRAADDVAAVVRFARERRLRVAPQSTGHAAGALASLGDTVVVKTARMREVTIDPAARRARVGAGAVWADVTGPAAAHGLAALAGSSPDVGVVGYCLGGGIGWLARPHGLACNRVTAVELVTADGGLRRVTADHEPELFWALRGGGGSFGVVTAIEIALQPLTEVYAGALLFPWERAGEVLHAWREWTATVPDAVTSVGRVLQLPPMPELPEALRGRQLAAVQACALTGADEGGELIAPLRGLGAEIDTFAMIDPPALSQLHLDPPEPVPALGGSRVLAGLPGEAVDALVAACGPGSGSSLLTVELRHLGGALGRRPEDAGALAAVAGDYLMFAAGIAGEAEAAAAVTGDVAAVRDALAPFDAGCGLANFVEEPTGPAAFHDDRTLARLRAVKAAYDPHDVVRASHPIEPAAP